MKFEWLLVTVTVIGLAACGADGEPVQPTARTNVTVSTSGVSMGTNVAFGRVPVALNLGLGL